MSVGQCDMQCKTFVILFKEIQNVMYIMLQYLAKLTTVLGNWETLHICPLKHSYHFLLLWTLSLSWSSCVSGRWMLMMQCHAVVLPCFSHLWVSSTLQPSPTQLHTQDWISSSQPWRRVNVKHGCAQLQSSTVWWIFPVWTHLLTLGINQLIKC